MNSNTRAQVLEKNPKILEEDLQYDHHSNHLRFSFSLYVHANFESLFCSTSLLLLYPHCIQTSDAPKLSLESLGYPSYVLFLLLHRKYGKKKKKKKTLLSIGCNKIQVI